MNRMFLALILSAACFTGTVRAESLPPTQGPDDGCELAWQKFVTANPANHLEKYRTTVEDASAGSDVLKMTSQVVNQKLVLESSLDQVTIEESAETLFPVPRAGLAHKNTVTRLDFILECGENPDQGSSHPATKIHLIDSGNRTVTVPAGTYACAYEKYSTVDLHSSNHEKVVETWVTTIGAASVTVKTVTEIPGERTTVELMEWR